MTWNMFRIRGFGTKPPFATIASWQRGPSWPPWSPPRWSEPTSWDAMPGLSELQKHPGICVGDVICTLSMSIFRFCCRTCWEILLDILLKRNLGHVSVHLNFVGVVSPTNSIGQNLLGNQFAENSQPRAFSTGVLKQIGFDFFVSGTLCKWA